MCNFEMPKFINQGWQCPVCGYIYSPTTPCCYNCNKTQKQHIASGSGDLLPETKRVTFTYTDNKEGSNERSNDC